MNFHKTPRILMVILLTLGFLLTATTASASKQAVVEIRSVEVLGGFGYFPFFTRLATWTKDGTVLVTVETPGATPSIMWPANIISGGRDFTYSGAYSPYARLVETYMMKAGTIAKSWAGAAAPGGTSFAGVGSPTTICFANNPPFSFGGTPLPNSCFPRFGSGMRMPGPKKFGGTARILQDSHFNGTILGYPTGLSLFENDWRFSSMLTGASGQSIPSYGLRFGGTATNTVIGTPRQTMGPETGLPWTTGVATVMGGSYNTQYTATGSHNFNTANLTGMISMVKPMLYNRYTRDAAGNFTGFASQGFHPMRLISFTFAGEVPEPGSMAMLGFGALGLAGLVAMRRR